MGKRGDMRRETADDLIARYSVQPLGGGSYGIYDRAQQRFTEYFSGRGARQKADRKWRALVGA